MRAAKERGLALGTVEDFDSPTGKGATGKVDGKSIAIGNSGYLSSIGIETASLDQEAERLRADGATVVNIAIDGKLAGLFAIADPVKASTPEALKALAAEGIKVIMLTGDNRTTAERRRAPAWHRRCRSGSAAGPEERRGRTICERRAASSRWPATASTTRRRWPRPMSASPWAPAPMSRWKAPAITLLKGDLTGIVRARKLSQATMANIRQNLFFAFIYNAAGIPIAAGILYPAFGILLSPIIAAAAMALSSVSVIGNALRLRATQR